jgi:hypothetical protein
VAVEESRFPTWRGDGSKLTVLDLLSMDEGIETDPPDFSSHFVHCSADLDAVPRSLSVELVAAVVPDYNVLPNVARSADAFEGRPCL